jgi:hypothetical protein
MALRGNNRRTAIFGMAALMLPAMTNADTICTHEPRFVDGAGGEVQAESQRAVKSRILGEYIEYGDAALARNRLTDAVYYYAKVFKPFAIKGRNFSAERCASQSLYEEAAEKLGGVASRLAAEELAQGHYLPGESPNKIRGHPGGALSLFLIGNDYDAFVEQSFDYAAHELRERDIQNKLTGLASQRLRELEATRGFGDGYRHTDLQDDTSPLLEAELAAFDKLKDLDTRLTAHLAPLYPAITDYWLEEEARRYRDLTARDSELQQSLLVDHAAGALADGIARLKRFPDEVGRLTSRGNKRGDALMDQQRYAMARAYFDAVGNEERHARANALTRRAEQATVRELKDKLQADIQKMQKTDEEKAAFEEDTDDMAAEFGFDLED